MGEYWLKTCSYSPVSENWRINRFNFEKLIVCHLILADQTKLSPNCFTVVLCLLLLLFLGECVPANSQYRSSDKAGILWLQQEHRSGRFLLNDQVRIWFTSLSITSWFCAVHAGRLWRRSYWGPQMVHRTEQSAFWALSWRPAAIGCAVFQVLSGGVVLQLTAGQKVWLESFKDKQKDTEARDTNDKQIIFSGFLLFADPE